MVKKFDMSIVSPQYSEFIFVYNGFLKNTVGVTDLEIGMLVLLATYTAGQSTRAIRTSKGKTLQTKTDFLREFSPLFGENFLSNFYDKAASRHWLYVGRNNKLCLTKELVLFFPGLCDAIDAPYIKIYVQPFQEAAGVFSDISVLERKRQLKFLGAITRILWKSKNNRVSCLSLKYTEKNWLAYSERKYFHKTKIPEEPIREYYIYKQKDNTVYFSPHIFFKGKDDAFAPVNRLNAMSLYDNLEEGSDI